MQDTRHRGVCRGLVEVGGRIERKAQIDGRRADDLRKRRIDCIQNGRTVPLSPPRRRGARIGSTHLAISLFTKPAR